MTERYFLKPGYRARFDPEYFVDENLNAVWQPDLYPDAAAVARRLRARTIVDIGCGTAAKLVALHPEFEIVGIDYGSNIAACRARYDFGIWIETDIDASDSLGYDGFSGAVLVCGDVVEHLVHPERLLRLLRGALDDGAAALLLTTPERDLGEDESDLGPPRNPAHVREWNRDELERFMASEGLTGFFGLTRSNDVMPYMRTTLAVVPGRAPEHEAVVREWFGERRRWERLAVEQDRTIADLERWTRQLQEARDWAEEQRARWQAAAEGAGAGTSGAAPAEETQETQEAQAMGRAEETALDVRPQVTVISEVEAAGAALPAAALAAQTFRAWEWRIATTDGAVTAPAEDSRTSVVRAESRARALSRAVDGAAGAVVLLDAAERLPPTALEKWLWFLETHLGCASVHSTSPQLAGRGRGGRMIRRETVTQVGTLDAAVEVAGASAGYVPIPEGGALEPGWAARRPEYHQTANEWLRDHVPVRNPLGGSGRRLLLIAPWMTTGGADKFNLDALDQLRRLGWEATVATTLEGGHELYAEYERRTLDLFPLADFLPLPDQPRFLRYLIESRRPDVVLVSNSELGYRLLPYLRATCPETPFVDFCHSEAEHWNSGGYPRFSVEYAGLLDLTITVSDHLRRWMIERGGDPSRIEVCTANVDVETFRPSATAREDLRERLGLPADEPVVLFAGRICQDKQPRVLADVLASVAGRGGRYTAVVAGDGPDRRWLERRVAQLGLGRRVRFLGSVDARDMAPLMAGSDVLFLPSRAEGIALALYEAMASGIPVVSARVGGQAELVTGECGVLVERSAPADETVAYADALEQLLRDVDRRRAMGAAARKRVETLFPLERMGDRLNELLERSIELHRSEPRPSPGRQVARASATEAIELTRLARVAEARWARLKPRTGPRGRTVALYVLLRRVAGPAYMWGVGRGWTWLPRARDVASRLLTGG